MQAIPRGAVRRQIFSPLIAAFSLLSTIYAHAATQTGPGPHVTPVMPSKAALTVISASGAVQYGSCDGSKPALIASVNIRNSGQQSLPASKGDVYVSEDNGSPNRLVSAGILLPAFAGGQTQTIKIPVNTLAPYSNLPGTHVLTVHLLPLIENGQPSFPKPTTDYQFSVTFPSNYCQSNKSTQTPLPGTRNNNPGATRGLNPQPDRPGIPPNRKMEQK